MSLMVSMKYVVDEASGVTANVSTGCLDPDDYPVLMELSGVTEASLDVTPQGVRVSVSIPRRRSAVRFAAITGAAC